jgi:hypothetical protein
MLHNWLGFGTGDRMDGSLLPLGGGRWGEAGRDVPVAGPTRDVSFSSSPMCHPPDSRRLMSFASHSRF